MFLSCSHFFVHVVHIVIIALIIMCMYIVIICCTDCYIDFFNDFILVQRESLENVNTTLRILTALAEDCPQDTLIRSDRQN